MKKRMSIIQIVGKIRWKKFDKNEKRMLKNINLAKKLIDREFSGSHSDALCDALADSSELLGKIIQTLEPS